MADAAAAMALALVDGRAVLTIATRDLGPFAPEGAQIEGLEIEWPAPGGAVALEQLRNRRGRLRAATLTVERARLPPGIRLTAGDGRRVRVAWPAGVSPDARAAVVAALGPATGGGADIGSGATVELDPLAAALDELLVAEGFRLPDSAALRFGAARTSNGRLILRWGAGDAAAQDEENELAALRRAADDTPAGPARAEAAHRLAVALERVGDEEAALTALEATIDHAGPGPLVGLAWRRLVELHARRGDPHAAARALIACADDRRVAASDAERAATLVAAAEILRKRLDLPADAGMLLERAITLDPSSAEALEALATLTADAGDFARLAELLERKIEVVARGPREQRVLLAELAEVYDRRLGRILEARRTYQRLLKIDPDNAAARGYLARVTPPAVRAVPVATETLPPDIGGDPTERRYWRLTGAESGPVLRANSLVAKARVALGRAEIPAAVGDLERALDGAPQHAGALALLAEISYRKQEWARARELYAALEKVPDAAEAIPREQLVQRRASLAQRLGETAEAEALYREVAILNPRHVEARRALAELALGRGDTASAALRLEELLRLMPTGTSTDLADLRHRLGAIYAETGDWPAARYYLELVTVQDPGRIPALELLLQIYEKLDAPHEASQICGRLARLYADRSHRAAILYRQGEIRRTALGDPAGALDAYLRSSDADPHFVPSRLRLVHHFWSEGDVDVVADLAHDLADAPLSPERDADLLARLSISAAGPRAVAGPRGGNAPRFPLAAHASLVDATARALAEAGERATARGVDLVDPLLTRARFWAGADGERALIGVLAAMVLADPAGTGAALVLGGLAARTRRPALARAAYSLPAFVDPDGLGARLLDALPPGDSVRADAVRVGAAVDHPDVAGPARRALARLAPALLGLGYDHPAPKPVEGSGLPPARASELRRIADLLVAPPFVVAPDTDVPGRPSSQSERRRLRLIPTQPAGLLISPSAATLGPAAWSFVAGRALEALRSGLVTAGLSGVDGLARLLEGARAALGGAEATEPRARAVAEWLGRPGVAVTLGAGEIRAALRDDVEAALTNLPDWQAFRRGTRHTCNRIGLLVCGSPADALAVVSEGELRGDDDEPPTAAARAEFLRGPSAREMLTFLFSPAYEAAIAT